MEQRKPVISVIGGSNTASAEAKQLAEEVGFLIARADAVLACGGLNGVMEAACKGAKRGGGLTIGVLPGSDPRGADPHGGAPRGTALSTARDAIVVPTGDPDIAVDGRYRTPAEIAYAVRLRQK